jgi:hypothetical protein
MQRYCFYEIEVGRKPLPAFFWVCCSIVPTERVSEMEEVQFTAHDHAVESKVGNADRDKFIGSTGTWAPFRIYRAILCPLPC